MSARGPGWIGCPLDLGPTLKVYPGLVGTYTIGQLAEHSGFSPSALRYYEGIGLVTPAGRTGAGYRIYDEKSVARLGFITRAKQLGCSLEEITDLVGTWEKEACGPVQHHLHGLVTDKVGQARRQITELTALATQLQAAATRLGGQPVDGPCDAACACAATMTPAPGELPIACTLEPDAVADRRAQWQAILDLAVARSSAPDGALRLEFGDGIALGELARQVEAEQACCAFFSFTMTLDGRGVALEVRAPERAADLVAALFGAPP